MSGLGPFRVHGLRAPLLGLMLAGGACAPTVGSSRGVASASAPGFDPGALDVGGAAAPPVQLPTLPGAGSYGAAGGEQLRARVPNDPLRHIVLEEVRRAARDLRRFEPLSDPRLDAVAQDLAAGLRGAELPPFETVDFLLRHYGLVEPAPNLLLARASGDAEQEVVRQMGGQIAELFKTAQIALVGTGIRRTPGGELAVVVALQERNVALGSVPRRVAIGEAIPVAGRLLSSYRRPEVIVTAPDGQARGQPTTTDPTANSFRADVRCDRGAGRYQVEVTGVDTLGTAVLANFPVFCGVAPPTTAPATAPARAQPWLAPESESRLLELVNRDRRAAHLPPVSLDAALTAVARAHSQDMADQGFVGHVSPTTGNALDRVRRLGIQPTLLLENVGRAYSPDEAEAGLMQSPGHRANIFVPGRDPDRDRCRDGPTGHGDQPAAGHPAVHVTAPASPPCWPPFWLSCRAPSLGTSTTSKTGPPLVMTIRHGPPVGAAPDASRSLTARASAAACSGSNPDAGTMGPAHSS